MKTRIRDKSVKDAISKVLYENKRIDVIVNNAGYALVDALEDLSMEEIKTQFEQFWGNKSNPDSIAHNGGIREAE